LISMAAGGHLPEGELDWVSRVAGG
jgi:hypothetical protein